MRLPSLACCVCCFAAIGLGGALWPSSAAPPADARPELAAGEKLVYEFRDDGPWWIKDKSGRDMLVTLKGARRPLRKNAVLIVDPRRWTQSSPRTLPPESFPLVLTHDGFFAEAWRATDGRDIWKGSYLPRD